ncbi:hypothetical protein C0J52_16237 [Blattella germanica]|nr:hypothetical protein C0J52_16237 [Blattella germanica]
MEMLKLGCLILPKREQHQKQFLRWIPGKQEESPLTLCNHGQKQDTGSRTAIPRRSSESVLNAIYSFASQLKDSFFHK